MAKGAAPGERRGGRQKGTPNRITADIKALAQSYGPDAIRRLISIIQDSESEMAQIAAVRELLDRGYGKSKQDIGLGGIEGAPAVQVNIVKAK
jgi:hypothetical protein